MIVIFCNLCYVILNCVIVIFCTFVVSDLSFICLLIVVCGSFALGRLFDFISAHFWPNGDLYFSFKNWFCGKSFISIYKSEDREAEE